MAIVNRQIFLGNDTRETIIYPLSNVQIASDGASANETLLTVSVPGGIMGPNDTLHIEGLLACTNNANAKNFVISAGDTSFDLFYNNYASSGGGNFVAFMRNNNSLTAQKTQARFVATGNAFTETGNMETGAVNTAADWDLLFRAEGMTATDYLYIESLEIYIRHGQ